MAILYRAELRPSKLELITPWLDAQPWSYPAEEWERVATFRFDDPAGEVGVETFILRSGNGAELHVPVTYRGAPLADAEGALIGTMEHSVLGSRWVYDACGDPVYAQTLASTILTGGREAEQFVETDGRRELVAGTAEVRGSGNSSSAVPVPAALEGTTVDGVSTIATETFELFVVRRVGQSVPDAATDTLTATWAQRSEPTPLAGIAVRA